MSEVLPDPAVPGGVNQVADNRRHLCPFVVRRASASGNVSLPAGYSQGGAFASFQVSSDRNACKGSYNALQGDEDAVFDVWCDNGEQGSARMVRDRHGRDGVGAVELNDGTEGRIVFGPMVAEVARSALRP